MDRHKTLKFSNHSKISWICINPSLRRKQLFWSDFFHFIVLKKWPLYKLIVYSFKSIYFNNLFFTKGLLIWGMITITVTKLMTCCHFFCCKGSFINHVDRLLTPLPFVENFTLCSNMDILETPSPPAILTWFMNALQLEKLLEWNSQSCLTICKLYAKLLRMH